MYNFATKQLIHKVMLGHTTRRIPIKGEAANEIRKAIARVASGQLNEQERASVERSKKLRRMYKATWIGLDGREL